MTKNDSINKIEVSELEDFDTFISSSEAKLALPVSLKLNRDSILHVYDKGTGTVFRIKRDGKLVGQFGGRGRGPGEFLNVNNMVIPNNYSYIVDGLQYRISKFSSGGVLEGTYKFGSGVGMPPPAPSSKTPRALDIYNEPSITKNGNVLLSTFGPEAKSNYLYQLLDWKGNQISRIGHVPEGSKSKFNSDRYLEAISNQKIPPYHKPNSFPINDQATQDEIYLVYSSYPKIAKYDTTGAKLWEQQIPKTPEIDSLITTFYNISEEFGKKGRTTLKTYVSGVTSLDGSLYMVLGKYYYQEPSNGIWVHKFNNNGELIRRYKLISDDVGLVPIFEFDSSGKQFFVVTERGGIRSYPIED